MKKLFLFLICSLFFSGCDTSKKNLENLDPKTLENVDLENVNDLEDLRQLETNLDEFAKCLSDKGFSMFGSDSCYYCNVQKEDFGESFQFIDFIDCKKDPTKCQENGITGYPTWKNSDKSLRGKQALETLAKESGCQLH